MAAPAIAVERYRVEYGEGFTMPVVSLTDRRAAGNRLVRFVFQRHLETVLTVTVINRPRQPTPKHNVP